MHVQGAEPGPSMVTDQPLLVSDGELHRALEKINVLIICISCVRRLIMMMAKTVTGMII